jgi:FAD binding domain/Berberine and berberine like
VEHPFRIEEIDRQALPALPVARPLAAAAAAAPAATSLPPLPTIPASDALLLTPGQAHYEDYMPAANLRTEQRPALRALCKTAAGVTALLDWIRSNNLPFALRSGGHSYEGFSQSTAVAVDLRLMNAITVDAANNSVTVGAGASLMQVYQALAAHNLALPAGSCPTVGISGHSTGGGFGFLARSHGLTCDCLSGLTMVDAQSQVVTADATNAADLFWACRGGGGGSFGVATEFRFNVFRLDSVIVFGVSWLLSPARAASVFSAWQAWAPGAPASITSIMKLGPGGNGTISMRCIGQTVGTQAELMHELAPLVAVQKPSSPLKTQTLSFLDAVNHFSGGTDYESTYFKAKSDYVLAPLSASAIGVMLQTLAPLAAGSIVLLCDAYGGRVADVAAADTAFPHRAGTSYCIQYFSSWAHAGDTAAHLATVAQVYQTLRPFMPGVCYVNYCDLDLGPTVYPTAYWGANLPRLSAIKLTVDPTNFFQHAQSVPLPATT